MRRSFFDISSVTRTTGDMGLIYPVKYLEMMPGDKFTMTVDSVVRMSPMVNPVLHHIDVDIMAFFVPYRLLMEDWEDFITGGKDGKNTSVPPLWMPNGGAFEEGTLADYFGIPLGLCLPDSSPLAWPKLAYNMVWNEWFRDQDLQEEVPLVQEDVLRRAWAKDYFSSMRPFPQKGDPVYADVEDIEGDIDFRHAAKFGTGTIHSVEEESLTLDGDGNVIVPYKHPGATHYDVDAFFQATGLKLSIEELRESVALQRWLEKNARAGNRYIQFLREHFNTSPTDARLQRPEYIGRCSSPVLISEVLQTSSTDSTSPQGNLAGHGLSAKADYLGSYYAKEHGALIYLASVVPQRSLNNVLDYALLRRDRYDYPFKEFAHLSPRPVTDREIGRLQNLKSNVIGYTHMYDEMRTSHDVISGKQRRGKDMQYWNLSDEFHGNGGDELQVECRPRSDVFAFPLEPNFVMAIGLGIGAYRPLPVRGIPGGI